eukprot:8050922-Lingulodinium_polyedra.AAC.1
MPLNLQAGANWPATKSAHLQQSLFSLQRRASPLFGEVVIIIGAGTRHGHLVGLSMQTRGSAR